MKILPFIAAASVCLSVCAADPADSPTPAKAKAGDEKPAESSKLSVTEHTVTVNGQVLKYKATAGYLTLSEEDQGKDDGKPDAGAQASASPLPEGGKPAAKIFFIAYTREGVDAASRPITFAFNGGPGAASVWLHLGQLGPRRLKLGELVPNQGPPYSLVDNDETWLTDTDLVFIDPVSTGYSRPAPGVSAGEFHNYQEDIKSVGEFIRLYTTQNDRWLSPKLIVGESYGGARAAGLCDYLQNEVGMYLDGVIIVSGVLSWENMDYSTGNDIAYCLGIPAYASTAWYYKKDAPEYQQQDILTVRHEAEQFAMNDYYMALGKGDLLPDADRDRIADQLSKFTGVPKDYIILHHLRFDITDFRRELLKSEGKAPGRFDSRYTGIVYDADGDIGDASLAAVRGAFTATINAYIRSELKFESDLPYNVLVDVDPWHFGSDNGYTDLAGPLAQAMTDNPRLKLWVLTGGYDLAIPYYSTVYTLNHMRLAPAIRQNITFSEYESGHMVYTDQIAMKKMRGDFETFLKTAVSGQ
ncbi:MAG: peptidase S10 [Chthoniobacteraceae bacterium]|jgi:carboxypeptidase C (cathepsin A)